MQWISSTVRMAVAHTVVSSLTIHESIYNTASYITLIKYTVPITWFGCIHTVDNKNDIHSLYDRAPCRRRALTRCHRRCVWLREIRIRNVGNHLPPRVTNLVPHEIRQYNAWLLTCANLINIGLLHFLAPMGLFLRKD